MDEKNIKDEQLYKRAFDAGFKLRLYNEDLYTKVVGVFKDKSDEYSVAFLEGSKEAEKEAELKKSKQKTDKNKEDLQNIRNRQSDKGKDIER